MSLGVREKRQTRVLSAVRGTQPAQMAMRLRRVAHTLGEVALDTSRPTDERVAAARAMMDAQAQILDIIGWTKRPAAPPAGRGGRLPAPVDITPGEIRDAAEVPPTP